MKILFLCTAHNSLSQRLYLCLSQHHAVTIEYALTDEIMREAVDLAKPDLILCPFLTTRVPNDICQRHMTLIVHPGPPGDAGPSSLDWVLLGDDGTEPDPSRLLQVLKGKTNDGMDSLSDNGRPHWGVTVLQAEEELDAGPVWAFEQFPIDIDDPSVTKSSLYRGAVTRAAVSACLAAVDRINAAAYASGPLTPPSSPPGACFLGPTCSHAIHPGLVPDSQFSTLSVGLRKPFLGGVTHHRPLLKASQRDFDVHIHTAKEISRRIRCSDSQPGCLTSVFGGGSSMYIYGGAIEEEPWISRSAIAVGSIAAVRNEAVCIKTVDKLGIWITHVRRVKKKTDAQLWPKVPAASSLVQMGILSAEQAAVVSPLAKPLPTKNWAKSLYGTHQEIWVDFAPAQDKPYSPRRVAYVYFHLYNGAMSTLQCDALLAALDHVLSQHTAQRPLAAVVLMGGSNYFSNGIHLNDIEASPLGAAQASWDNINRINDVVHYLLHEFPRRRILTVAGIRGNAAAGGVALATACDFVVAGAEVVLNPAYRALGLYGSEYHSLSYTGRCGVQGAKRVLRDMTPLSAYDARSVGLVDYVIHGHGTLLETRIQDHVKALVRSLGYVQGSWKANVDLSPRGLARARAMELGEMAQDFWGPRSMRYHSRREAFVRKVKAVSTPLRFAKHRRGGGGGAAKDSPTSRDSTSSLDEEETDSFDSTEYFLRKMVTEARTGQQEHGNVLLQSQSLTTDLGKVLAAVTEVQLRMDDKSQPMTRDREPIFSCYYSSS
ncbi:ClpP/crotonase-like domain-containing protein [Coniella lustricola]|uniref:ClpP/crotonase-like domain-containing protein n=1 Tax=Coniella lustricola TaxID=2025994 RepID=A0A2T2ZSJ6_9PEZI|nr:ClpP/crotonase-like domain-containing protein [Coniella lustricola]